MKYSVKLIIPIIFFLLNITNISISGDEVFCSSDVQQLKFSDSLKVKIESIIKVLALKNKCRVTAKIADDSYDFFYTGFDD